MADPLGYSPFKTNKKEGQCGGFSEKLHWIGHFSGFYSFFPPETPVVYKVRWNFKKSSEGKMCETNVAQNVSINTLK